MRILHKASLVFQLKDIISKYPIANASILCNGKQNPYTKKSDGYYVFSDLYPGDYEISIRANGYVDMNFSVTLKENETQVMVMDMPYSVDNMSIYRANRFEFLLSHKKEKCAKTKVTIKLKNELDFLELIQPIEFDNSAKTSEKQKDESEEKKETKLNGDEAKLNIGMNTMIIGQKYIYKVGRKEYELTLWGYDPEKQCYTLKDYVSENIAAGGKFYPVWDLQTDAKGRVVLPFMAHLMNPSGGGLVFELTSDDLKATAEANLADFAKDNVIYLNVSMRQPKTKK